MKMVMASKGPLCQSEGIGITSPQVLMQEQLHTLNIKCALCVHDLTHFQHNVLSMLALKYNVLSKYASLFVLSAENGDYWRLLTSGTHIVSASAPGYSRAMKRVFLPDHLQVAGRVDFVLRKVPLEPDMDELNTLHLSNYERFDPYNQIARYSTREPRQREEERQEKPWWWSYFSQLGNQNPSWLLRNQLHLVL